MKLNEERLVPFAPVMLAIFFGNFLAVLATSAVNLALPVFIDHFHSDLSTVQWVMTGFILASGTVAPMIGYLGDRIGYKRLYLLALTGFIMASILCALAWNIQVLIGFRFIQGIFTGVVMPTTMAILYQVISSKKLAHALSLWNLSSMLAPAIGPTLSGWMIQQFDWQTIFWINLPIGLLAIFVVWKLIPDYRLTSTKTLDVLSITAVSLGSISLLIAFSEAGNWGLMSWKTILLLFIGIGTIFWFFLREQQKKEPMLNLSVLKYAPFTYSLILNCVFNISLYAGIIFVPMYLQTILFASPLEAGLILLPASIAMAITMPVAGKLYDIVGPYRLIFCGILFIVIGTGALGFLSTNSSTWYVTIWMTVRNIGISLATMPATNVGMAVIPRHLSGHASAMSSWTRQLFASLTVSMFTLFLTLKSAQYMNKNGYPMIEEWLLKAQVIGMNGIFILSTISVLLALPFLFLLKQSDKKRSQIAKMAETL